jgi:hypothetical protein
MRGHFTWVPGTAVSPARLVGFRRKRDGADVHRFEQGIVDDVDGEPLGDTHVQAVSLSSCPPCSAADGDDRRIG